MATLLTQHENQSSTWYTGSYINYLNPDYFSTFCPSQSLVYYFMYMALISSPSRKLIYKFNCNYFLHFSRRVNFLPSLPWRIMILLLNFPSKLNFVNLRMDSQMQKKLFYFLNMKRVCFS